MDRAPVYQDADNRIVSRPGNLWVRQVRGTEKSTREFDAWQDRSRPLPLVKAMLELKKDLKNG